MTTAHRQQSKTRRPLAEMQAIAVDLVEYLRPCIERIEIAGSIRRGGS